MTTTYIHEPFCGDVFEQPSLVDCLIYGSGRVKITPDGKSTGDDYFSIAPSADPDNVVEIAKVTLILKRQSMEKLLRKAKDPAL